MATAFDFRYVETIVAFLEMHQNPQTILPERAGVSFKLLPKPLGVEEYRKYYYAVGSAFQWLDRMVMPYNELAEKINAREVFVYLMFVDDQPAGFAEFLSTPAFTEILYFGLFPAFVGKGWGSYFLHWCIAKAWSFGPQWIQLNTCQLDHPNALPVYRNAGFQEIRTIVEPRKILSSTNNQ